MAKTPHSKPTIFLADDDPDDQELLLDAFREITDSYHIHVAGSGKDLIALLSHLNDQELPCLIVLDYNMPELNGKEVLKYLQGSTRYRHIPIVIYSTSNSFLDKAEFLSMGAAEFITKASSVREILSSAKKMLSYCEEDIRKTA